MVSAMMLLAAVHVQGQAPPPDAARYARARLVFPDATSYAVTDLRIEGDLVSFRPPNSATRASLPLSDVARIQVWDGASVGLYTIVSAVGVGSLAAYVVLRVNEDPDYEGEPISYAPWVIGSAAFGGIVGYFVGSRDGKWKGIGYTVSPTFEMAHKVLPSQVGLHVRLTLRIP